jgi:hypothetical protein
MAGVKLEPIKPKKPYLLDTRKYRSGVDRAVNDTLTAVDSNFKFTVKTWKRKVKFHKSKASRVRGTVEGSVTTGDEIYGYVTMGTKRHFVRPRHKSLLRFQTKYRAKTRPRIVGSRAGGASGPWAFSKGHWVKGIEAREFQTEIAKRRQRNFDNFMLRAYAQAVR